jgi:hypothetical protein
MEEHKMMPSPLKRLPRVVILATHLYHLLIRLGPEKFLQEYEEYMLSDFRRHCHEVYKRQGIYGLLRECSPMFIKALVDMSEERVLSQKKETAEHDTFVAVAPLAVAVIVASHAVLKVYHRNRNEAEVIISKYNEKGGPK